jgi:hypothetical protein
MSFQAKVIGGTAVVLGAALLFILFFRSSEEEAIEKWLRAGAEAAQTADADAVVAMLSLAFKSSQGDHAWAVGRIRGALQRSPGFIEVLGCAVQVDDEVNAGATLRLRGYVGKNELWRTAFSLRLRKEGGAWKVISAEQLD